MATSVNYKYMFMLHDTAAFFLAGGGGGGVSLQYTRVNMANTGVSESLSDF